MTGVLFAFMKKIFIILGSILIVPILLLLLALSAVNKIVTDEFIVSQLEKNMNLRAELKKIDVSLFSTISSIHLEGLKLNNRDKYADDAVPLKDRPPLQSALISMENFEFELNFLAILKGEVQLKKLLLLDPEINLVLFEKGGNNLSSLFLPPKIVEGKPNEKLTNPQKEIPKEPEDTDEEDPTPFSIKSIPVSANLKEIGIKSGNINILVKKTAQKLNIQSLNLLINSIDIVPDDLKNHNSVTVDFNFILKVISTETKLERANLLFKSNAKVSPFVVETGFVNPAITYKMTFQKDSFMEGLAIFESITNSVPLLKNAGIEPKGLNGKSTLTKDTTAEILYSAGKIKFLQDVTFETKNYDLELIKASEISISTSSHTFNANLKLSREESDKSLSGVTKIKSEKPEMAPLVDGILSKVTKENRLFIPFQSTGNLNNPNVTVNLELPSLLDSVKGMILDKASEELQKQLKDKLPIGGDLLKKIF